MFYPSCHASALAHHVEKYGMVLTTVAKVISQNTLYFHAKFRVLYPQNVEVPKPLWGALARHGHSLPYVKI